MLSPKQMIRRACLSVPMFLTITACPLLSQSPTSGTPSLFSQSSGDLHSILTASAQKVLSSCQSWPPKLAKKASDQNKDPNNKNLVDGSDVITTQLGEVLNIDPAVKPFFYDASFLRLLDSVGTFDPGEPNSQLLGIALQVDPTQLQLWGNSTSTVKFDCLSMLSLAAKAGAHFSIPFFSLNAAFQASQSVSSNQTSTFFFGTLQSPFDFMYNSSDQSQRLFAALKAIQWRLNNATTTTSRDQYIATARFLTVQRGYTASENTSFLGNMKAGLTFPLASLSGDISGQYTTSLQASATSYQTYFWSQNMKTVLDLDKLTNAAANNLLPLVPDVTELRTGTTVKATASIPGWPADQCLAGGWTLTSRNPSFSMPSLSMTKATSTSAMPTCTLTAAFSFSGQPSQNSSRATSQAQTDSLVQPPSDNLSPQLYLVNASNPSVSIPLSLSTTLHKAGTPSARVQPVSASWGVEQDSSTQQKSSLYWTVEGTADIPSGRVISSMQLRPNDFTCKAADGTTLPFTDAVFNGAAQNSPQEKTGNDPRFTIFVFLSLTGIPSYIDDINQKNKKICVINGAVRVTSTDANGSNSSTDVANFKTGQVYYPNEATSPVPPANLSATSTATAQVSLSWTASANATGYDVYRGTTQGAEQLLKAGVQGASYLDASVVTGTTYYYKIVAVNSIGASPPSNEASVTAH